ncbi:hypothetical protein [Algoriphagus terrigena]|uniref:hypothetical protein n=1 Tax=Algoriphagus terrigena TaxID=344884 RepID=UPI0003F9F401|nr:hypothetical protein [Algoriphagus terrigena]
MTKSFLWIVIGLFFPLAIQAQDALIPEDSLGFRDFLILQKEVTGLEYQFLIMGDNIPDSLLRDSVYTFSKTDLGLVSGQFEDFGKLDTLEAPLAQSNVAYQLQYLVFSEISSRATVREYLSTLIENGGHQIKVVEPQSKIDLVALASKSPYSPLQKFKLKFVSDYRLFGVTLTIAFFFLVASTMIAAMLVMKARKNQRENLEKEYESIVIDPLTSLLFEKELHEIEQMDQEEIYLFFPQQMLSKKLFKHVLIESIIGLNKKMKGEFKEKLKALYKKLELDKMSIRSLHHKKWDRVTMGLAQINEMDLVEAMPEVKKFTNSKNFYIRSMAVSTILNLSEKVDLKFLRDQTYPISLWQQMNYLRIIRFVSSQKNIKLEVLFDSENPSIRIFGIKLVRILGRVDLIENLAAFAGSVSDEEKMEILETYASFGAHMEAGFVNECMKSSNQALVLAATKVAMVIGDAESAEILVGLIHSESSFPRKLSLLKSLYGLDKERFDTETTDHPSSEISDIRSHILDPMLQHV